MFLDLRTVKKSGKESEDFFFEYTPEGDLVDIPNATLKPPVKVSGQITLVGNHSAYIEGEVCFSISGECTRCLEQTDRQFVIEINEQVEENNPDGYSVVNDRIDLGKIVEDAILINLPLNFLCKEDCRGLCAECGANLNKEDCKCKN